MSTTAAPETRMFDPSQYDLEGTPVLNGEKASRILLAFEAFELDHTDAEHMGLAGHLEDGDTVTLTVTAKATKLAWSQRPDAPPPGEKGSEERLGRRYTLTIRDVTA